jgi:hypothetical protein
MAEQYIKAEIVRPKRNTTDDLVSIVKSLFTLAIRVLVIWWFVAAWFPEYGITYWQAILAVAAIRMLVTSTPTPWRQLA